MTHLTPFRAWHLGALDVQPEQAFTRSLMSHDYAEAHEGNAMTALIDGKPVACAGIADFEGVPLPAPPAASAVARPSVLDWDDDTDVPEADPVIDGVFDQGATVIVYGRANVGKSFVVQKMTHCVAAGLPFAGRDVEQGAVLYVATEGHAGIRRRLKAMRKALAAGAG